MADLSQADRAQAARALLDRCAQSSAPATDDEAIRRAGELAAAAVEYLESAGANAAALDDHLAAEFADQDIDATMATMSGQPWLNHVPVMTGGTGTEEVRRFYEHHFIPGWPADTTSTPVARTIGADRIVDELVLSFTHDKEMDAILPGLPPSGKRVEMAFAVVVGFEGGKVAYERIYWDQASALVQVGALDPDGLPVSGAEQARKVLDPTLAANELMGRWPESA